MIMALLETVAPMPPLFMQQTLQIPQVIGRTYVCDGTHGMPGARRYLRGKRKRRGRRGKAPITLDLRSILPSFVLDQCTGKTSSDCIDIVRSHLKGLVLTNKYCFSVHNQDDLLTMDYHPNRIRIAVDESDLVVAASIS